MKRLLFPLCSSFLILSCSKDSQQSKTALLTAGTWKITADSINPGRSINGQIEHDMYPFYYACDKDDYFSFSTDGVYELNNGGQKCSPADPQKIEGTWFFSNGDTKLNLSPYNNYLSSICDILELSTSRLKLVWHNRDQSGAIIRTHVLTLTH